jgi:2,4-dienoyl-CoA reductase-like NADH-dependent reductase (Old Yellow Enzyme family)
MPTLQDQIRIGDWELPNRVIMAPLTRCRSSKGRAPNDLMRQYYQQRASAGLIISEATSMETLVCSDPKSRS